MAVWSRSAPIGLGIARSGLAKPLLQIFSTTARMDSKGLFFNTKGIPTPRRLMLLGLWPMAYRASRKIDQQLLAKCRPIVFSEVMRSQISHDYGLDSSKIHLCQPGVDTDFFSAENGESQYSALTKEFGLRPEDPYILYVGRLWRGKNLAVLLDAYAAIRDRARLVLVGNGPDETSLRERVRELGLEDRVLFLGVQSELLPGLYRMARVCVLPSIVESFGQTYLESLACGTPVVGIAGDGKRVLTATTEIVRDGETGTVAREATAEGLAKGMISILELGEDQYQAMNEAGVRDVEVPLAST